MAKSFVIILFTILFGLIHVSEKQHNNYTDDKSQIIKISLVRSSSSCEVIELDLPFLSLNYRSNRIPYSLHTHEESLGTSKLQEHVEANRYVIIVIGNIEIYYSLVFPIF